MEQLKIELNGSAGHINVRPGYSCGPARYGLMIELESEIQCSGPRDGLWHHGGVMSRKDMKKLRDLIDDELSKPIPKGR